MTARMDARVREWLARSAADAGDRGLADLKPLLEGLARAVSTLRAAEWNDDAGGSAGRSQRDARPLR